MTMRNNQTRASNQKFEVQAGGQSFEVEAPDMATAAQAVKRMFPNEASPSIAHRNPWDAFPLADAKPAGDEWDRFPLVDAPSSGERGPQAPPVRIAREADPTPAQMAGADAERLRGQVARASEGLGADEAFGLGIARAVPGAAKIGSWIDYGLGIGQGRGAKSYEETLARNRAMIEGADKAHPYAGLAGQAVGGTAFGGALVKGGLSLLARGAGGLPSQMARAGVDGALFGMAHAAADDDGDLASRAVAAAKAAPVGFGLGAIMPAAGAMASGAINGARSLVAPVGGIGGRAAGLLERAIASDPPGMLSKGAGPGLLSLGPEGALADVNGATRALAQGVATARAGKGSALVDMLRARDAGTGARLAQATDEALGKAVRPSAIEADLRAGQRALGPDYEAALGNARAVNMQPLADQLDAMAVNARGEGSNVLRQIRSWLNIPGAGDALDPNPRALLNTRQAIDGLAGSAERTGDRNVSRLVGEARRAVDDELAAKVPGIKDVDRNFAGLAAQRDALETGQAAFDTARSSFTHPRDLAAYLSQTAEPAPGMVGPSAVPFRARQGARAEIDRIVSTSTDDLRGLENQFGKSANAEKLGLFFGTEKASRLIEALAANRQMRDTLNAVDRGSQTAQRTAAAAQVSPDRINIPSVGEIPSKLANVILNRAVRGSGETTVGKLDKALALQGAERDALAKALLDRAGIRTQTRQIAGGALNPYGVNSEDDGRASTVDWLLRALGFMPKAVGAR